MQQTAGPGAYNPGHYLLMSNKDDERMRNLILVHAYATDEELGPAAVGGAILVIILLGVVCLLHGCQ